MPAPASTTAAEPIPALRPGDRLSRAEFERRYQAMPEHVKAELIDGVVYMASPVRFDTHGEHHLTLATWLGNYRIHTPGVRAAADTTVRLDWETEVQPDLCLVVDHPTLGRTRWEDHYLSGPPEFVAEISASSKGYDLGVKLAAYRVAGVPEYLVWRTEESALDWYRLRDGAYVPLPADEQGVVHSEVFPGLWLSVADLLAGRLPAVLVVLADGLRSAEHAAFVARLAAQADPKETHGHE